jgi:predicted transcriptional regulator
MTWKAEAERLKREAAKPPKGCKTIAEIADELGGITESSARKIVRDLVKGGRCEAVPGKQLTAAGQLIPATFYRLVRP